MLAYLSTETFLNVSVQRSTGNLSWNRAHVQKEMKEENYMWQRQEQ